MILGKQKKKTKNTSRNESLTKIYIKVGIIYLFKDHAYILSKKKDHAYMMLSSN